MSLRWTVCCDLSIVDVFVCSLSANRLLGFYVAPQSIRLNALGSLRNSSNPAGTGMCFLYLRLKSITIIGRCFPCPRLVTRLALASAASTLSKMKGSLRPFTYRWFECSSTMYHSPSPSSNRSFSVITITLCVPSCVSASALSCLISARC